MNEKGLRFLFEEGAAVRIIGAAEADKAPGAHIDVHGFPARRTGWALRGFQLAGALQAELPMADLAQIPFQAAGRLPVAIDGIRPAARAKNSGNQFPLCLSVSGRPRH
jgi:hypothetical protein